MHQKSPKMKSDYVQQLSSLWFDTFFTDITILIEDEQFHAHRAVLSARSPVFQAMLRSPMQEGKECKIRIIDTNPTIFRKFLEFIYTDSVLLYTIEQATELVELADKYQVLYLVHLLADRSASTEETLALADVCIKRNSIEFQNITNRLLHQLGEVNSAVMASPQFMKISHSLLEYILSHRRNVLATELEIFEAIVRWSDSSSTEKRDISSLLLLVDYRRIWSGDLYSKVVPLEAVDPYLILEVLRERLGDEKRMFYQSFPFARPTYKLGSYQIGSTRK